MRWAGGRGSSIKRSERRFLRAALLLTLPSICNCAFAQAADQEAAAIVEVGGAGSWNLKGGSSLGADLAVEFTPIQNWLEMEIGTTPLFSAHTVEWDTDVLLKKPWTLSKKAELMIGAGPEWVHTRRFGMGTNAFAGEIALDFMYWPGGQRRFGWFVEPAYEYVFGRDHEKAIGASWGLLIAIP